MNVALPAIVLFLLVAPGFIYHHFSQAREVREADMTPFGTTVLKSVVVAFFINAIVGGIGSTCFGYQLYLGDAVRLLSGTTAASTVPPERYGWLNDHPWPVLTYFCVTHLLSFGLAFVRRIAVSQFELDHPNKKFASFFRHQAPWHYLFSGIDVVGNETPGGVLVSAVVSLKDASYLYTGLLEDYEVKTDGELDRIILSSAMRRKIEDDRILQFEDEHDEDKAHELFALCGNGSAPAKERFYPIEGDRLILRASEWVTLNVKFIAAVTDSILEAETESAQSVAS
ncbi:DUF6338 family protein [Cupriavidus sp. Agwp_2]|uniref:DUF6338 family protein n=1 Tax=Cupriavidus sp. Agwp_2 TaxID=2897324 RepID=UPI00345F8C99